MTRHSYGVSRLTDTSARSLALEFVHQIGALYEDDALANMKEFQFIETPCCDVNAASRVLGLALARDVAGWATLLDIKDKVAAPLRACARWKIERLSRGLMLIEEALLERDYLNEDEPPEPGRAVITFEAKS